MAFIKTISEADATGTLTDLYTKVGNGDGTVDNVMKIHSLNEAALAGHFEVYVAAMHRPSPLSRIMREIVGVIVSRLNGCDYCQRHHAAGLDRLARHDRAGLGDALLAGEYSGLSQKERAMAAYATTLTQSPEAINAADIQALRDAGLDDREIHDLAHVVAYFCYANRIVTGLGVALEGGGIGQHSSVS
jgi:uncharacterized peroxidase-related enzyme